MAFQNSENIIAFKRNVVEDNAPRNIRLVKPRSQRAGESYRFAYGTKCTCLTKSPKLSAHSRTCKYRQANEITEETFNETS